MVLCCVVNKRCLPLQFDAVEVVVDKYDSFGRKFMRSVKQHPDTFTQMAIQLAYYSIYHK